MTGLFVAWLMATAWAQESTAAHALAEAAARCDPSKIKALLDQGVSPNARDRNGEPVLILAVDFTSRCDPAVVKLLLDHGADVNVRDSRGDTPLIQAATGHASEHSVIGSSLPVVRLLLDRGADVNARNDQGRTPLTALAGQFAGQTAVMRLLLDRGAAISANALLLAAGGGHADEVRLLLDRHTSVNARDADGRTALMEAAKSEWDAQSAVLKLLLARGAERNAADKAGHNAAWFAADAGYPDRVTLLSGSKSARQLSLDRGLLRFVGQGDEHGVDSLLRRGADPNVRSEEGSPALVLAAEKNHAPESVRLLLDHGARVDEPDSDGKTALMVAAMHFGLKIVEMLLDKGAGIEARDRKGNTAMLEATCASAYPEGRKELVELLLDHGANARASNTDGVTAVMLAARCSSLGLEALVDRGADVNAADNDGRTALMIASVQGDERFVKFLLESGADVRARDKAGRPVLLISIDAPANFSYNNQIRYSYQIASLLVVRGAGVNDAGPGGETPLMTAVRRGYPDMVRLLIEWKADVNARNAAGETPLSLAAGGPLDPVLRRAGAIR